MSDILVETLNASITVDVMTGGVPIIIDASALTAQAITLQVSGLPGPLGNPGLPGLQGLQGIQGVQGQIGASGLVLGIATPQTGEALLAGQPVYVSPADNLARRACADVASRWLMAGCVAANVASGFRASVYLNAIDLPDWSAVTGTVALTPGQVYWLDDTNPGRFVTTAPNTSGKALVVAGRAASSSVLALAPQIYPLT